LGYDFKRQRIVKKIRGRKCGQAMAGLAGPPTMALIKMSKENRGFHSNFGVQAVAVKSSNGLN